MSAKKVKEKERQEEFSSAVKNIDEVKRFLVHMKETLDEETLRKLMDGHSVKQNEFTVSEHEALQAEVGGNNSDYIEEMEPLHPDFEDSEGSVDLGPYTYRSAISQKERI